MSQQQPPEPNQDLPVEPLEPNQDLPEQPVDPNDPEANNDLPGRQPPRGPDQNRGRDEEARREAPGQNKP